MTRRTERRSPRHRGRILAAALGAILLLGGCTVVRERDVLAAQYYPDPAFAGRRTAFLAKPGPYAPPRVPPAVQAWPPGFY